MSVRQNVSCTQCGSNIVRVVWNYGKKRPITEFFCNNDCKGAWQKKQREALGFNESWLREQYCKRGRSANDIAREIGRDPKRVWEWIRDYGIETRARGSDYGQRFALGQRSAFKGRKHTEANKALFREKRLQDGRVPYLKDGLHWLKHEGAISPNYKGGITPERQAFYASDKWKEAAKAVYSRDKSTCQRCGIKPKKRGILHVHHIVSFSDHSLRSDPDNLVILCAHCHRWVHSKANTSKDYLGGSA